MHRFVRLFALFLLCLAAVALTAGCAPRRQGASAQQFYASGLANFSISVAPPLTLSGSGRLLCPVPSDVTFNPNATFAYAVFGESKEGPVVRHVHTVFSELPRQSWRWEKETWALAQAVSYEKLRRGGKYWTVQMLPVVSEGDWFSALWRENGRQTPEFWLAKRWSATPEEHMRVLAEYREPAPACMQRRLQQSLEADARNAIPLRGKALRAGCVDELEAFSARADQAILLETMAAASSGQPTELPQLTQRPTARPDMGSLVGKAQKGSNDSHEYPD